MKTRRKYTLLVDGASPASRRGPNSLRAGRALYVGGVPPQGTEQRGQDSNSRIPGQKKLEMLVSAAGRWGGGGGGLEVGMVLGLGRVVLLVLHLFLIFIISHIHLFLIYIILISLTFST